VRKERKKEEAHAKFAMKRISWFANFVSLRDIFFLAYFA
jgi:hypothetical protein